MQINSINNSAFGMAKTTPSSELLLRSVANSTDKAVQDAISTIKALYPHEFILITNRSKDLGDYVVLTNRHSHRCPYFYLTKFDSNNPEETVLKTAKLMKALDEIRKDCFEFYS